MSLELFEKAVLTHDVPEHRLRAGDVGVIVEKYPSDSERPEGYELEFSSASGETVAVTTVAAEIVREATPRDLLSVREFTRA